MCKLSRFTVIRRIGQLGEEFGDADSLVEVARFPTRAEARRWADALNQSTMPQEDYYISTEAL